MAFNPTREQENAIKATGNILISAAAGSGKTAVLVERVIKKLCDKENGISADKLLIVTYTNAAAAEMRSRIEARLEEEIAKTEDNAHLIYQKHLLPTAKISTVDSFCIDLVRENFEVLGVSPDFKMSDPKSLKLTDISVISKIIERKIEENDPVFLELLDIIGSEYDENGFINFVLDIFDYSRQLPFPESWFKSFGDIYSSGKFEKENIWYKYSFEKAKKTIKSARKALSNAIDLMSVSSAAAEGYIPTLSEASKKLYELEEICDSGEWDELYNALNNLFLPNLPTGVKGVSKIPEINSAKSIYKYIQTKIFESLKKLFYANLEFLNSQFAKLKEPIKLLSEILIEFDNALFEEYKKENTFTFHNTEHLALKLLCRRSEQNEKGIEILPNAKELIDRFGEVMVDECQDTNDLQDLLFYVLSDRESKLFVVGDVKQSIYRFRGANPKNFLDKKNSYIPYEVSEENEPKKIVLGANFRCKNEVCDFVNFFFELFMTGETGEIIYGEEERLIPAAEYPETNIVSTEFCVVETKGEDEKDIKIEAMHIAKYIRKVMNEGAVIRVDKSTLRKADYSDFAILLRNANLKGPVLASALKECGIPVAISKESFIESFEIAVVLSLLKVIDNPRNDIELLAVMMSPIFRFTAEDMAKIRVNSKYTTLYNAVSTYALKDEKTAEFLETLKKLRVYAAVNSVDKIIGYILDKTDFLQMSLILNDGIRRRNNLNLLCDLAKGYSESQGGSIGGFVKYIEKQSEYGIKVGGTVSGDNSVKIMSIHGSKGLQFPVCILAELSNGFSKTDSKKSAVYSTGNGIGFKYYDETQKERFTTIGREAILDKANAENLSEELRLFYVAMTRTQDRLFMIGCVSDLEKKTKEYTSLLMTSNNKISFDLFLKTNSYFDWLMLSLLLHPDGKILRDSGHSLVVLNTDSRINFNIKNGIPDLENQKAEDNTVCQADRNITDAIKQNLNFVYPFEELLEIESKASVSSIVGKAESMKYAFSYKPAFLSEGGITSAEKGTAMHKVMEYFDFDKCDDIEAELERLYEWQYISEKEYNSIDKSKLQSFFKSDIFNRIKNALSLNREMRFLTEVEAGSIKPDLKDNISNEKIIVQGAVDVCFTEPDGVVILDFKTDRVDNMDILAKTYGEQLNIYAMACEKIFQMPVKQKIIYSFELLEEIEV